MYVFGDELVGLRLHLLVERWRLFFLFLDLVLGSLVASQAGVDFSNVFVEREDGERAPHGLLCGR